MAPIVELFVPLIFDVVFYGVGRFIIPILSLGRARGERPGEFLRNKNRYYTRSEGKITFSAGMTGVLGLLFVVLVAVVGYLIKQKLA